MAVLRHCMYPDTSNSLPPKYYGSFGRNRDFFQTHCMKYCCAFKFKCVINKYTCISDLQKHFFCQQNIFSIEMKKFATEHIPKFRPFWRKNEEKSKKWKFWWLGLMFQKSQKSNFLPKTCLNSPKQLSDQIWYQNNRY